METVTISKVEYEALKRKSEVDWELVGKFRDSFEALKDGRVIEWRPLGKSSFSK